MASAAFRVRLRWPSRLGDVNGRRATLAQRLRRYVRAARNVRHRLLLIAFLGLPAVFAVAVNGDEEAMSDLVSNSYPLPKERRSGNAGILIAVLGLAAILTAGLPAIRTDVFAAMSTDDAMRLVEVRDLINGQGWFDLWQHRLDPPGVLMHWSRVVDLPLAVSILLLKPLIGMHNAEVATLCLWPLLLFAIALMLVAAIARQMSNGAMTSQAGAVVLAMLAMPALVHFRLGAIDHHNAQIDLLLALILFTLQIERSAFKAALAGLAASLSLAIGIEMLPAIAAICVAVAGLFIWRGAPVARQVAAFAVSLAASSLVLALALLPLPGLVSPVCDSIGGPVLLLTIGGGVGLTIMVGIDRCHTALWLRLATAAGTAVALLGAFSSLFPACLASPYALVDPLVMSLWLDQVQESISLGRMLQLAPEQAFGFYAFPLITLGIAAAALIRSNPLERFRWIVGIVALAALIGVSVWELRGTGGASMVAAPIFAAAAVVVWPSLAMGRNLILLALLVSPASFAVLGPAAKPLIDLIYVSKMTIPDATCQSASDAASLNQLPRGRVMAPIDIGPAILLETGHDIFAAPYHRNNAGNLATLELMLAPPPMAHRILSDHHVDYVVICRKAPDQAVIDRAPDGLAARLGRGETPEFLEPIDLGPAAKIYAWRLRK
jgi:hypothetical protein